MGPKRVRVSAAGASGARKAARAKIGRLGDNIVTKRVLTQYTQFAARFFEWAYGSPVRPRALNFDQLDQLCAEYVEHLWGEGEPKGWAAYTLAAVQHFVPGARHHLPSAWRLKAAWDKLELPERAPPMTQGVALAVAGVMLTVGHPRSALAVALAFHCVLRTGEALMVRKCDITIARSKKSAIINLRLTKSGQRLNQHEVVSVDDAKLVQWLERALEKLKPGDPIVAQTPQGFRKLFYGALKVLGLSGYNFKPYSLRRGGATHHYRVKGDINGTALRGRWANIKTARIYITDALVKLQEATITPKELEAIQKFKLVAVKAAG